MAIYRGKGGKTDVVPADGDQEFAGSIIAEKDIHAHGNISADGDITVGGDIHWDGTITGNGSGLENVPTPFLQADDCIYLNNQVITNDYTMPVGKNGMSAGDITINGEVTIPDGSLWHVVGDDKEVTLESLGISNHDLVVVDDGGNVTATSFNGDGSGLTNLPIIEGYTKDEIDEQQDAQDVKIQANTDAINAIPGAVDAYTKAEIDAQQNTQDTEINKKADTTDVDAKNALQDAEIDTKIGDAPVDGEQYVRKDGVWAEVAAADGGITDAPADGKTYGRKDLKWEEVVADGYTEAETDALLNDKADKADTYTKAEVDAQQLVQDAEITANTTDIATNTADIAENKTNIQQNTTDIESLIDDVDALTGSVIYKGSLNATVTPAPADAVIGDMYINEYNVAEPATNYPVASGWGPVTEVKYDDKLIKTDTGWDKIESVVGVSTYTAGEIDDLLDDKADKGDSYLKAESDATNEAQDALIQANTEAIADLPEPVDAYTKTETDTLLDNKANVGDSYTKAETYSNVEVDTKLFEKADKSTTYTKTEVDASQATQDTEIAKKANQDTTYTKDEVDSLLESASGAIVGNYTNKHASGGVARDPLAGNLYLSNGMSFSTDYNAVTSIYISDTDGDGEVRDFDEVQVADKITLTSVDGSGEYTIVTISDVGGYRELVVNTDSATGTIADDTPVSIVLDVASSGETGGGIEEAPADGKQYARQDEAWTEVEATSGGGGVEAQPPVAFNVKGTNNDDTPYPDQSEQFLNLEESEVTFDTDSGVDKDKDAYIVPKDGIYKFDCGIFYSTSGGAGCAFKVYRDGSLHYSSVYQYLQIFDYPYNAYTSTNTQVIECKKGDEVKVAYWGKAKTGNDSYYVRGTRCFFSGHMVSSITEGEVKEKEAITMRASITGTQNVAKGTWEKVKFDTVAWDTDSSFDIATNSYIPKVAGYYQVNAGASCSDGSTTRQGVTIQRNEEASDVTSYNLSTSGTNTNVNVSTIVYCNGVDDALSVLVNHASSGSLPVKTNSNTTYFTAHLITGQSSGGGSGGGSIWTEEDGKAVYDGNIGLGEVSAISQDVNSLYVGANFTGTSGDNKYQKTGNCAVKQTFDSATGSMKFELAPEGTKGDDIAWTEAMTIDSNGSVNVNLAEPDNSGTTDALVIKNSADQSGDGSSIKFLCGQSTETGAQISAVGRSLNKAELVFSTGNLDAMTITQNGTVVIPATSSFQTFNDNIVHQNLPTTTTKSNVYLEPSNGRLYRSTTTSYSAEEVDKKLAIKDKLIEKLSARLDELEKRVK